MPIGGTIGPGQCIKSANGQFSLVMQSDGNLVSYRNSNSQVCFNSHSSGQPGNSAHVYGASDGYPISVEVRGGSGGVDTVYYGSGTGTLNLSVNATGKMYVGQAAFGGC